MNIIILIFIHTTTTVNKILLKKQKKLTVLLLSASWLLLVVDSEVAQLVHIRLGSHHAQVVAQRLLLEVLLGQVLQVPLRERQLGCDDQLGALASDGDHLFQVSCLAVDLDAVVQELLEVGWVEHAVSYWDLAVHSELGRLGLGLLALLLLMQRGAHRQQQMRSKHVRVIVSARSSDTLAGAYRSTPLAARLRVR
jgi:hypothetical protein